MKIQGQGHGWGTSLKSQCESNILSTHIPFVPSQSAVPFLRYDFFKFDGKSKVKEEVNIESHIMGPTIYRLTSISFHVNQPSHSWYDFFKIWPWKSEVKVTREGNVENHKVGVTSYQLTFLSFHVKWTMTVHNYRPRQSHRTSNGENPSSGDRDMGFTSLAAARSTARPPACPNHDNNTPPAQRAEG